MWTNLACGWRLVCVMPLPYAIIATEWSIPSLSIWQDSQHPPLHHPLLISTHGWMCTHIGNLSCKTLLRSSTFTWTHIHTWISSCYYSTRLFNCIQPNSIIIIIKTRIILKAPWAQNWCSHFVVSNYTYLYRESIYIYI